jgi:hypothetical protein
VIDDGVDEVDSGGVQLAAGEKGVEDFLGGALVEADE